MNRLFFRCYFFFLLIPAALSAQNRIFHPVNVKQAVYFDVTPPLRNMHIIKKVREEKEKEMFNETDLRALTDHMPHPFLPVVDPAWQKENNTYTPSPSAPVENFEGIPNIYGYYPPDTQGDVGLNDYVQVVNIGFEIWNKSGTSLYGPATLSTIWQGIPAPWNNTNSGDPVVLYDHAANRWIISQFSLPNSTQYAELVAVSQTSDPTGSWYRYVFQFGNKMPDYPKLGVWPDAYYLSANQFISGSAWGGVAACALERSKMLTGDASARMVYFDLGSNSDPASMLPSDWNGTTAPNTNEPDHFTYFNDWSSLTEQYLNIWDFHVDWNNTSNSTFSEAYSLLTAPFNSYLCGAIRSNCIPQPGTPVLLEALSDRLNVSFAVQEFRNLPGDGNQS